jgi:hypothetical protein
LPQSERAERESESERERERERGRERECEERGERERERGEMRDEREIMLYTPSHKSDTNPALSHCGTARAAQA